LHLALLEPAAAEDPVAAAAAAAGVALPTAGLGAGASPGGTLQSEGLQDTHMAKIMQQGAVLTCLDGAALLAAGLGAGTSPGGTLRDIALLLLQGS
jgi:hypothetical protein